MQENPLVVYLLSFSIHHYWMTELHCSQSVKLFVLLVHDGSQLPCCVLQVTKVLHKAWGYPIISHWILASIVPSHIATERCNHKREAGAHVCVRETDFSQLPKVLMSCLNLTSVSCTLEMNPSQLRNKVLGKMSLTNCALEGSLTNEAFTTNVKKKLIWRWFMLYFAFIFWLGESYILSVYPVHLQSVNDGKYSGPCLNSSPFPWTDFTCCLLYCQLSLLNRFHFPSPCSFFCEYKKVHNESGPLPR